MITLSVVAYELEYLKTKFTQILNIIIYRKYYKNKYNMQIKIYLIHYIFKSLGSYIGDEENTKQFLDETI